MKRYSLILLCIGYVLFWGAIITEAAGLGFTYVRVLYGLSAFFLLVSLALDNMKE